MPTYAYACTECGHNFEAVQSFSDDTLTVCPECEGRLRKVFSNVGVVFKGSGFYRNDSRTADSGKKSGDKTGSSSGESSGSKDSKDSKSTDTKSSEKKSDSAGSGNAGGNSNSTTKSSSGSSSSRGAGSAA